MPINTYSPSSTSTVDTNIRGKKLEENEIPSLLFAQVEKPKNLYAVKAINVFDNRYRINVWVEIKEDGLTKRKIGASYFAVLDDGELRIKS